jgi:hypothetical protein
MMFGGFLVFEIISKWIEAEKTIVSLGLRRLKTIDYVK